MLPNHRGFSDEGRWLIFMKMGIEKEEDSHTVQFTSKMLGTGLSRISSKIAPMEEYFEWEWTVGHCLWIALTIGCKLYLMYIWSTVGSKYTRSVNYYSPKINVFLLLRISILKTHGNLCSYYKAYYN